MTEIAWGDERIVVNREVLEITAIVPCAERYALRELALDLCGCFKVIGPQARRQFIGIHERIRIVLPEIQIRDLSALTVHERIREIAVHDEIAVVGPGPVRFDDRTHNGIVAAETTRSCAIL